MFLLENSQSINCSLLSILKLRAQSQPNKQVYIFLQDGEIESGSLTYKELDVKATTIAFHLQSFKGERALLLYPSGLEFITAFFGCLYAGVVAVPVYPPRRNQKLSRLLSIVNDAQAKVALTTTSILADIDERWKEESELAQLKLIATDTIETNLQEFVLKSATPESLAFLQYTSGSTGTPKGVMVTHGNIIHNQQVIQQAFGHSEQSIGVGWLPLFHDMGLIGHVLQPIYVGFASILMPPVAFLQKPIRWLQVISKYRATTSGGPNFAYDLCARKIQLEQLANVDLSSWNLAYSGAEPVRAETLNLFGKKFTACGFDYSAFYPCYGMAETTLFATGGNKNQLPVIHGVKAKDLEQNLVVESKISLNESRVFVGVGHPYMDTTVSIVNPDSFSRCEQGQVGEIWVSGESVTSGYWNRPEATQETFQAYVKDTGDGPFLRTGDLGFLWNGELFVTGRLKDVIIIRGRNYYPQDIELSVENSHEALRANSGSAFSVEVQEGERLVVVQEVERNYLRTLNLPEVVEAIQKAVLAQHDLTVYAVALIKTGAIPKTSSGKIQRHICRTKFLENTLELIEIWKLSKIEFSQSKNDKKLVLTDFLSNNSLYFWIEDWLVKKIQIDKTLISPKKYFSAYGLDSLTSAELAFDIENYLNNSIKLPANLIWEFPTIESLVHHLTNTLDIPSESCFQVNSLKHQYNANILSEISFPISLRQEWFYYNYYPSLTINATIEIVGELNIAALKKSINEIIRRHSILRANFSVINGKPVHIIAPSLTVALTIIDLRELSSSEKTLKYLELIEENTLRSFNINYLPLIRTQLLYLEQDKYLLSFFINHIICDGFSIAVLVRELSVLYNAFSNKQPSPLAELPIQYADFVRWEQQHINSEEWSICNSYWKNKLANAQPFFKLTQVPVLSPCTTYSFNLSTKLIKSLRDMASKENVSLFILMLTVFKALLYISTNDDDIIVGVFDNNRIPSETQALIGQFATRLLLRTKFSVNLPFRKLLIQVRDTYFEGCKYNLPNINSGQPLIECEPVLFNFIQIPSDVKYPSILQSSLIDFADLKETSQDLNVRIIDEVDKVYGKVFYTNRLFNIDKIDNLFNCYCRLLEQVVCQPEINVSDLKFLCNS
ncbi:AMP-binding protein [Nostoc commune]|uniref:AMP-binding protein n=1 Tax=Nostoc commune TaxID=1178 RepID=UPI0018C78AED|nr:fatty acyl-AMP ligase [Nostoc commune]MBG1262820.1 AMP-binding protein [Nostoc commune BAE]MBG1263816.1 AMP-binding protein [Nostoc commune BAE]